MLEFFEKENLIFIDTEFTDLNPYTGELLSIGIVKLTGEELYIELDYKGDTHKWVTKHIIPTLKDPKMNAAQTKQLIIEFLKGSMPYAVGFIDNYDVIYLTKLFGVGNLPFKWQTIDFASILFAIGVSPEKSPKGDSGPIPYYKKLGIDMSKYRNHHALDDAKMLRQAWMKLSKLK